MKIWMNTEQICMNNIRPLIHNVISPNNKLKRPHFDAYTVFGLRGAFTVAGRYQYLSSDRAKTSSLYVKTHFMSFLFQDFFLKFVIVFEKNRFFKVIFKLSHQMNISINFLVLSMYTKRNYWKLYWVIFFIFVSAHQEMQNSFFLLLPFLFIFSLKRSLNINSKIYSIEVLAWGLLFLMRPRLYKSVGKWWSCLDLKR